MSEQNSESYITLICKHTNYKVELPQRCLAISGFLSAALQRDPTITELSIDLQQHAFLYVIEYLEIHADSQPSTIEPPLRSRQIGRAS